MTTSVIHLNLDQESDAQLIERCMQNGAQANRALRELIRRYYKLVYHFIQRMTNQIEISEELTQDVFLKAHQNFHRFDTSKPLKPWLMRIASNTAISALRKQKKQTGQQSSLQAMSLDDLAEQGWYQKEQDMTPVSMATPTTTPHQALENQADREVIIKALEQLDEKYRQVLILRYLQDFSYEDISSSLGIPLNTVRTWLRRGLEHFKQQLSKNSSTAISVT